MKAINYCSVFLISFFALISCNTTADKPAIHDTVYVEKKPDTIPATPDITIPKEATEGDFNGDGVKEYVWLVAPKLKTDGADCEGDCDCYLKFSNPAIPELKVQQCIGGMPASKGDLNDDKGDEIGLLREWFSSCWSGYLVYTLKNNKWVYAVEPFSTHCNQWEAGINPIEKDTNNPGHVIIRYSEMTEDSIALREKSVPVR